MALLDEIAAKLVALGVGSITAPITIFLGSMPASPDACCAIYETGGIAPEMGFGSAGIRYETPAVQLLFRGAAFDYVTPRGLAQTAYEGLSAVEAATLSAGIGETSAFYHWIHPMQAPFSLGPDENQRHRIAFNVLCEKERSA